MKNKKKFELTQEAEQRKNEKKKKEIDTFIQEIFGSTELKYITLVALALGFVCLVNYIAIHEFHLALPLVKGKRGRTHEGYFIYPAIVFTFFFILFKFSQALIYLYRLIIKHLNKKS